MTEKSKENRFVRLIFTGLDGLSRSLEITTEHIDSLYGEGIYFDGSSVPGYAPVNNSDMLLMPAWDKPRQCPWSGNVAMVLCSAYSEPKVPAIGDPRHLVTSMSQKLRHAGLVLQIGCELEFFLVTNAATGEVVPADRGGYMASYPADRGLYLRRSIIGSLHQLEIPVVAHHHEVSQGQHEIVLKHSDATTTADSIALARLVTSEMAGREGLTATFMPKPFTDMNGNGLHLHQSIWSSKAKQNLFAMASGEGLSELALSYVAGILEHAEALSAIVSPTVNSYKRLRPFFEAPTTVAWGRSNRSSMIRIPKTSGDLRKQRIEMRCPDPSCSPHLAIAAIMAAGLDGIEKELTPAASREDNLFEDSRDTRHLPHSLLDALKHLKRSSALRDALGTETIDTVVKLREREWKEYNMTTGEQDPDRISEWEIERYLQAI